MNRIQWIDSLCPRMHNLLQVKFAREYQYDFVLAENARKHSIWMMQTGNFRHCPFVDVDEALGAVEVRGYDEEALQRLTDVWRESRRHRDLLASNNFIGMGFAYDDRLDLLYATVRLKK